MNKFMKKKLYITPLMEVSHLETDVIMQAFGPASMPGDPTNQAPRKRWTDVF